MASVFNEYLKAIGNKPIGESAGQAIEAAPKKITSIYKTYLSTVVTKTPVVEAVAADPKAAPVVEAKKDDVQPATVVEAVQPAPAGYRCRFCGGHNTV